MEEIRQKFESLPVEGSQGLFVTEETKEAILNHFNTVFKNNRGYNIIKKLRKDGVAEGPLVNLSPNERSKFKHALLTSTPPERIFAQHRSFYRDNRKRFKFNNVKMLCTTKCTY